MSELEFDLQHGILTLRSDGCAIRTLPLPPELIGERSGVENITGVTALPELAQLRLALATGEHIGVQLRAPRVSIEQLRAGRPIVYLDQNHWSRLSAARFGHRPLAPAVAAAAERLMQWAQDGRVLVPASSAHFTETVPLYGASRLATATAILQVSGGWQMRNPLHVRLEEIRRAVAGRAAGAAEVFAPQADVSSPRAPTSGRTPATARSPTCWPSRRRSSGSTTPCSRPTPSPTRARSPRRRLAARPRSGPAWPASCTPIGSPPRPCAWSPPRRSSRT